MAELRCSQRAGELEPVLGLRPGCLNVPDPVRHDGEVCARLQGSPVSGQLAVRFGDLTPGRGSGIFHAAVAGAAPTDMRLYDTHWRERF